MQNMQYMQYMLYMQNIHNMRNMQINSKYAEDAKYAKNATIIQTISATVERKVWPIGYERAASTGSTRSWEAWFMGNLLVLGLDSSSFSKPSFLTTASCFLSFSFTPPFVPFSSCCCHITYSDKHKHAAYFHHTKTHTITQHHIFR